ncbi:MAG TPA: hypothetical protein PLU64_08575 [Saprospiraceae bacterium]|nr:hypothetical protein [Saprospiraceae bacterium]
MNSKEQNPEVLKAAIRQLPAYRPPDTVWGDIEAALGQMEQEQALREALAQLPAYSPPESLWETIEAELPDVNRKAPRLRAISWASAAAAAVVLLSIAWFLWPSPDSPFEVSYAYETTTGSNPTLFENDWDEDEPALKKAVDQFSQDPVARQDPAYQSLLVEWKELNEAKAEVVEIMERYGKDGRLIRQLSEIERERSALAKQMVIQI